MIDAIPDAEVRWLSRFFSDTNSLSWDQVISLEARPEWLAQVTPWLKLLAAEEPLFPVVLPVLSSSAPCVWYAMAVSERMAAMLAAELAAFVGPSYSDFDGHPCALRLDNEIERALHERFGNFVFRFSGLSQTSCLQIAEALTMYHAVVSRRPAIPDRTERPFGRIRADFDNALLAGNEPSAQKLLAELSDSGRINAEQRKCLDIRLLAGLGRQDELARNRSLIASVMDLSLPPQTAADLVLALYDQYIAPVEEDADSARVVAAFQQHIAKPYGPLFRERKGIREPKVLRAFLLFELSQDRPNYERCAAILAAYAEQAEGRALAQRWFAHHLETKKGSRSDTLERARQAIADEDYQIAFDLCFEAIPDVWAYSGLLRCAEALNTTEITARTLSALNDAPPQVRKMLSSRDETRLRQLGASAEQSPIEPIDTGWTAWARWVTTGGYDKSPIAILETAVLRWSIEEYAHDDVHCQELASLMGNATGEAERVFRDAFPKLVNFFVEKPAQPARAFTPLYTMLVNVMAWSGALSADELELTTSVAQALLAVGPTRNEYKECAEGLREIVAENSSSAHLDWALNTAELLAIYPVQDQEARLAYFMSVIAVVQASAHRISAAQRGILEVLAKDFGCLQLLQSLPPIESSEVAEPTEGFTGLIGIYTLTEAAGQRARQMLQTLLPKAKIELNGDEVATDRLKNLAANADIFVFAWKSSKHQAYYCVKAARGAKELLMPLGKGSASILRSVLGRLTGYGGGEINSG